MIFAVADVQPPPLPWFRSLFSLLWLLNRCKARFELGTDAARREEEEGAGEDEAGEEEADGGGARQGLPLFFRNKFVLDEEEEEDGGRFPLLRSSVI